MTVDVTLTPGAQSDQQQRKSAANAVTVAEAILSKSPSMTAMASAQAVSNMVAKKIGNHDPLRCFALVLWRPESEDELSHNILSSGAAGLGLQSIDLELPEGGNGRSVREWCDAIIAAAKENGGGKSKEEEEEEEKREAERAGSRWPFNPPRVLFSPSSLYSVNFKRIEVYTRGMCGRLLVLRGLKRCRDKAAYGGSRLMGE